MQVCKTKVYQLFLGLTPQERKDFVRTLRMHSKPKRAKLKAGFQFLRTLHERLLPEAITNQQWWAQVFPGQPYDPKAMRKHQNALIADLEAFLVARKWHRESDAYLATVRAAEQLLLLLRALLQRNRDHLFRQYMKKAEAHIAALPLDHDRHALQFQLELLKIDFQQRTAPFKPRQEFARSQAALDRYYVAYSLKLEVATRNHQSINLHQNDLGRVNAVIALMDTFSEKDDLTQLCSQMLSMEESTTYPEIRDLLERLIAAAQAMAPETWKDLMYVLLNFAIRRINEGQETFQSIALEIYLDLLETGHLQKDTASFRYNFLNILRLAFNQDAHGRLSQYIQAQKAILEQDPEYQHAGLFYQCESYYAAGETRNACNCFWKVWMLEGGTKVRHSAGIFLLKTYYDLGEWDPLKQFATDFKKVIQADKAIPQAKKEAYTEFLKGLQFLAKIRFQGLTLPRQKKLQQLGQSVATSPRMISRGWLLGKIESLWETKK